MHTLITREQAIEILKKMEDPLLHRTLEETNGILEVKVKEEKAHISVKLAIAKTGTPEQFQLQMKVVDALKKAGANTVGIRFAPLPQQELDRLRKKALFPMNQRDFYPQIVKQRLLPLLVGKAELESLPFLSISLFALARLGKKVGLLDADIYGFSVPDMMGIIERPKVRGNRIIPVERFGVKVISMAFFVEDNAPVIVWTDARENVK